MLPHTSQAEGRARPVARPRGVILPRAAPGSRDGRAQPRRPIVSHIEGTAADPAFERIGLEFLADFLARSARHRPDDVEVLGLLATTLTQLGRHHEGLGFDRRLALLLPDDATVRYNLACSLALCQDAAAALRELERAVELGYDDAVHLLADEDLRSLRTEPGFVALLERLRAQP